MKIKIPSHLTDAELTAELKRLVWEERERTVVVVAHLVEFDARRLYLGAGFPSLYTYCRGVLHMSEYESYHRIKAAPEARTYDHPEAKTLLRPDVGTQASFRKKKPPQTYRYDSSLSPALAWDDQNAARELGEWLIALIEESSRLEPPHEFAQPRRLTVAGRALPAWFLDTDYNGLCFHVCQAFFPRTAAWDDLKRSLKGQFDDSVWDHLAGTKSEPFEAGEHGQVAVKVIDDRGNELLVLGSLREADA